MVVFFKNYKRSDRTFLSIQTVKHLFPDLKICCLFLYDENEDEYESDINQFESVGVTCYTDRKKHNFNNVNGQGSSLNGFYFTEGINKIFNIMKDHNGKLLVLDEDSYFINGKTIEFLLSTDFDLAYANWHSPNREHPIGINGSIISFNPKKVEDFFDLPERKQYIEDLLGFEFYDKCVNRGLEVIKIPTRDYDNYHGDGKHTNDINVIISDMDMNKITYEKL
jgi:hypothetical protein